MSSQTTAGTATDGFQMPNSLMMGEQSKQMAALNKALAAAQGEFPPLKRERTVEVQTKTGGKYTYDYAPLEAILPLVLPVLSKHGLAIVQLLEPGPSLRTELRHAEGGVLSSSFPFKAADSPQALGSVVTYLRRYALVALLGIAAEHDDDAQQAQDDGGALRAGAEGAPPSSSEVETVDRKRMMAKLHVELKELEEAYPVDEEQGLLSWKGQMRERFKVTSAAQLTNEQLSDAIAWVIATRENEGIPF